MLLDMTKFLTLLVASSIVIAIGYSLVNKHSADATVSPAAGYDISTREIDMSQKQAMAGDCKAAYRLANYHSSVTLKSEEAIRWLHLAVKCSDVNPKLQLIAMLIGDERHEILAEVDRLIAQVRKVDPIAAKRAQDAVLESRNGANPKGVELTRNPQVL